MMNCKKESKESYNQSSSSSAVFPLMYGFFTNIDKREEKGKSFGIACMKAMMEKDCNNRYKEKIWPVRIT